MNCGPPGLAYAPRPSTTIPINTHTPGCTYCCLQGCEDWTCRACERFPGMDKVVEIHAWRHDAHGFVGHNHDNASSPIVAAFTGTDPLSLPDWVDDLDFVKTAYPSPPFACPPGGHCRVHQGFLEAYLQMREQVLDGLRTLRQAYPEAPILLTGHSLGGVFATFAAIDVLHALKESVQALYTFGKPRVGNWAWQVRWLI